ncbi:MAG: DUF192 domain-containing protein [Candidatus Micrarchaeia archaeon]
MEGFRQSIILTLLILVVFLSMLFLMFLNIKGNNISFYEFPKANITVCYSIMNINNLSCMKEKVYLATTVQEQSKGYMNASNTILFGMLFIFNNESTQCFWMKNTKIPLEQLWISNNGTVLYSYYAEPESNLSKCYIGRYVLETNPLPRDIKIAKVYYTNS